MSWARSRFSFNDVMAAMKPYYVLRLFAGVLFLVGAVLLTWNLARTFAGRSAIVVMPPATAVAGATA